ncbi:MAG TPA: hypothetical protein VGP47_04640 [Parachlamydiaceae bacterium]|nr:hypothetical protein [Parachlamydiaceae bacterium]
MNDSIESMRLLLELALNSGRKRKSQQTGYLHHCYHLVEHEPHLPIPLIENFMFALALLRSRLVENIQEAKSIMDGLLHFQNKNPQDQSFGNYPIYIHDFPNCKDRFIGIQVAPVIYWILKQFHQVIGQDLKKRLEESLVMAVKHAILTSKDRQASYPTAVKIAAAAIATGQLVGDSLLSDEGSSLLESLRSTPEESSLYCPVSMGSIATSLLMVYPHLIDSPWKFFWDHLQSTWHRGTASYAGPSLKEWQQKFEPQVTLYDLICGYFSGVFSDRALKEAPVHLEAVLIPFTDERFQPLSYPYETTGEIQGIKWFLHQSENLAFSFIDKGTIQINQAFEKGFHPFKLLWGDIHRVHSLVSQGGTAAAVTFKHSREMEDDKTIQDFELDFDLDGAIEVEDKEKSREILLFADAHEGIEFLVSGFKASTFKMDEMITMVDKYLSIQLSFHIIEGDGRFFGHRMLGNRPSQLAIKGEERFNAYDWQLFMRTINRSDKCRIKAKLRASIN